MIKLTFEEKAPSGVVIINSSEFGIVGSFKYVANNFFLKEGEYDEFIENIEKENHDKILLVINDNSKHVYKNRCYIGVYTKEELKSVIKSIDKVNISIDSISDDGIITVWLWREGVIINTKWESNKPIWEIMTSKQVFGIMHGETIEINSEILKVNFTSVE